MQPALSTVAPDTANIPDVDCQLPLFPHALYIFNPEIGPEKQKTLSCRKKSFDTSTSNFLTSWITYRIAAYSRGNVASIKFRLTSEQYAGGPIKERRGSVVQLSNF